MIGKDIKFAKKLLEEGKLVAIPTETVYGLAANALDIQAVIQIFEVKNRPTFDPLIVHTHSLEKIKDLVLNIPKKAILLAEKLMPAPLTLLLPKKNIIPDLVTSGLPDVAIRIPNHQIALELLKNLDFPLAAPSANPFGYVSPTSAIHVEQQLGHKIPYILDGGNCEIGIESTIIGFQTDIPTVYRMGGISIEIIEKIIGKVQIQTHSSSNPKAAGMLESHYAPKKQLILGNIEEMLDIYKDHKLGILSFQKDFQQKNQIILSKKGNLAQAAQHLFAALRTFDSFDIDFILAELVPDLDLGRAINDRLKRANWKK
ncbi:MAG: threonylcarbamoyl-AMP synthase [Bacteroidetes bacterium]|nr:MAG: threonylcarbamoyl-AMP synthase [Bacteroidota bacterium]